MTWLFAALVIVVMGGIAVVAAGRAGSMPPAYDDSPDVVLPDGPLRPEDLRKVRFPLALRGYRMAEVDELLDRLATQLDQDGHDDSRGNEADD
jgi:DivIVA domain-containing protein